jgi:hypothetical protein
LILALQLRRRILVLLLVRYRSQTPYLRFQRAQLVQLLLFLRIRLLVLGIIKQ